MTISKTLAATLDKLFSQTPALIEFRKIKTTGADLGNYFLETSATQCQIMFYRDKWWTKESGGTVYGELYCLVPAVQLALCGKSQSLAEPDYSIPFHHFQYGTTTSDPVRSWQIQSQHDAQSFAAIIQPWLTDIALPWFAQFNNHAGIINFMETNKQLLNLALWQASLGHHLQAKAYTHNWLATLPRNINQKLPLLLAAELITQTDLDTLSQAAIQGVDDYQERINIWLAGMN